MLFRSRKAQAAGAFRTDFSPEFATLCFYGAIEQLLTAWIFEVLPRTDEEYERAKGLVVEAICGGLESGGNGATGPSA